MSGKTAVNRVTTIVDNTKKKMEQLITSSQSRISEGSERASECV
jgi:hypothetical protein